jgi:hypothetical protein
MTATAAAMVVLAVSLHHHFFCTSIQKNQILRLWNWIQMKNCYREETTAEQSLFTNKMDLKKTYSHYNIWSDKTEKKVKRRPIN